MNHIHPWATRSGSRRGQGLLPAIRRPTLGGAVLKLGLALLLAGVLMSGAAFSADMAGFLG
jgi:hypothetical protein